MKRLEAELADRKKTFAAKQTEFENEKATWENKYKLFNNELKKKDNVIKKYSEISGASTKDGNVVNGLEIVGEFGKQASKFYGSSEVVFGNKPYAEFMSFCQSSTRDQFEAMRKENDSMREQLSEMNQMMDDIVKVRKAVIEQKLIEMDKPEEQGIIVQIRQELLNLKDTDMELSSLTTLRENMKRFKEFMDKVDSVGLNVALNKGYQYEQDADIDEIKNLKRLKDLLSTFC